MNAAMTAPYDESRGRIQDLVKEAYNPIAEQFANLDQGGMSFMSSGFADKAAQSAGGIGRQVAYDTEMNRMNQLNQLSNTYLGLMGQGQQAQYGTLNNALGAYTGLAGQMSSPYYAAPDFAYKPSQSETGFNTAMGAAGLGVDIASMIAGLPPGLGSGLSSLFQTNPSTSVMSGAQGSMNSGMAGYGMQQPNYNFLGSMGQTSQSPYNIGFLGGGAGGGYNPMTQGQMFGQTRWLY